MSLGGGGRRKEVERRGEGWIEKGGGKQAETVDMEQRRRAEMGDEEEEQEQEEEQEEQEQEQQQFRRKEDVKTNEAHEITPACCYSNAELKMSSG